MVYDADFREANVGALETATPLINVGADAPGAFVVPTNVSHITELRFAIGLSCADDTAFRAPSAFHIYGGGVKLQEGWFPGPCATTMGIAAASGNRMGDRTQKYLTNIPVCPGGQFAIDAYMLGEDVGALQMMAQVVYDGPVVGKIVDMDYRSIDLTAVNTWVTLTERGAAVVEGDIRPHKGVIGELYFGVASTITVGAANVTVFGFQLSGPGLLNAGNYRFLNGMTIGSSTEAGADTFISELEKFIAQIPVKIGNSIRVQGNMIETDVGTSTAVVGFAYY